MKVQSLILLSSLAGLPLAQNNLLSSILSDAQSIYTAVTSILAPATTSTTSASSTTSAATSTSASSAASTSSSALPSSTFSTSSLPSSTITPSASSTTAAAQSSLTGAAAADNGNGNGGISNTLAIVLGCTLGALALAAFIALIFLCRRRRQKQSKNSAKHRPLSPDDDEIGSWRHEKPHMRSLKGPTEHTTSIDDTTHGVPMTQHGRHAHGQHQNPFVPVPPPPRGTHSRGGMHNSTEYSAHPFSPDHVHTGGSLSQGLGYNNHHGGNALAAGMGGAALGGLAAHAADRHERKRSASRGRNVVSEKADPTFSEDEHNTLPEAAVVDRRSGSIGRASAKDPWPFMDAQSRRSMESSRSRNRSLNRHQDYFSTPDQHPAEHSHSHTGEGLAGGAVVGGLTGAVAARKATSRSPHRKGILKNHLSDISDPSSGSSSDRPRSMESAVETRTDGAHTGPHELGNSDIPLAPTTQERRDSTLGTAAPTAAAAAYHNRVSIYSRETNSTTPSPVAIPTSGTDRPVVPSHSPTHTNMDYSRARYSSANEGTVELPGTLPHRQTLVSPTMDPEAATDQDGLLSPVSPLYSQTGSWSKAQAEQLGMSPSGVAVKTTSEESTALNSDSRAHDPDSESEHRSSGLVTAIQKIFSSQKHAWAENESAASPSAARTSGTYEHDIDVYRSMPRRKPAPERSSRPYDSHRGDTGTGEVIPGAWVQEAEPLHETGPYESIDSTRPPPLYRPRSNSNPNTHVTDFAPQQPSGNVVANTHHPRSAPRPSPGYGLGSGDPFDLARTRTDSSATGITLSNDQQPAAEPRTGRPRSHRASSGHKYEGPTLADLRREVMEEDRERAKVAWRRSQSRERSNSASLRYGNDRELFNLVDQTTGQGRFYASGNEAREGGGAVVGRAY